MAVLALSTPVALILTFFLLFALAVVVTYAFSLVRHAKSLAKDAKAAAERLNEAAAAVESQVKVIAEHAGGLGERARPSKGRGRRV